MNCNAQQSYQETQQIYNRNLQSVLMWFMITRIPVATAISVLPKNIDARIFENQ